MSHSNTSPVRNRAPLIIRSSSLRCVCSRAPHCRTVLQNWQHKTPKASPKKGSIIEHSPGLPRETKSLRSSSRTERKCFSNVILELKVTPNITRSSDSFSTVQIIVNEVDFGSIVRDLETIIVLVLLAFNFIPQRSHHSLTLRRSRIREFATVTLTPGDGTTAIEVGSAWQINK